MDKELFKRIYRLIKKYDEIVIARHIGPDPDAVASQIALRDSIRLTFPEKRVYAIGAGVSKFKYLGYLDRVDYNSLTNTLLIVLDVPNFHRVDGLDGLTYQDIIKIDHHPKEDIIGTEDFTSSNFSSTAEMVAELLFNSKLLMNKAIAEKLFLGIISDSERFLFKNTQVHTFEVVTKLIKDYNLDFTNLYNHLYEKHFNECKFEAYIINNLEITDNHFGHIVIDHEKLTEFGLDVSATAAMINNFNFIKELYVWCFVTYDVRNEIYKVNIRSRDIVINDIAAKYNGGGHAYASGARIVNKEDIAKLFNDLDDACRKYIEKENSEKTKED